MYCCDCKSRSEDIDVPCISLARGKGNEDISAGCCDVDCSLLIFECLLISIVSYCNAVSNTLWLEGGSGRGDVLVEVGLGIEGLST